MMYSTSLSFGFILLWDLNICVGEAEQPAYGLSRRDAKPITQRVINLIPKGLKLPRFPFFSIGGSTAPGECGCKCEFRSVRFFFYKNTRINHL